MVLVGLDGRQRIVLAADRAARKAGLRPGMPATKAQAVLPGLQIHDADIKGDFEGLERLALWALQRYAPIVAPDPPDGLVIDTTGADHLYGGEAAMLQDIVDRVTRSGVEARAAVADTWGTAHAFARHAARPTFIVPVGECAKAIGPLPVSALRLPPDMGMGLHVLGFDRIADLMQQPRGPLALRFGSELGRRLDQAVGRQAEPIDPIRPKDLIEARRAFAEPIAAPETIARYTSKLVGQLCQGLEERGLGARRLDLLFHRVDSHREAIRVGTARPVREAKRLTRLLTDKIETIDPGFGIEVMELIATLSEPLSPRQINSGLAAEAEADVSDLVDMLTNRLGEKRLYRIVPMASDVPERSMQRVEPNAPDTGQGWPIQWPRPTRLLSPPELIETVALLPDHPPVSFTWRGVRRRVRRADGPERVFGEWWKRDPELLAVRDYFQVEDDAGERYWIFRAGDG